MYISELRRIQIQVRSEMNELESEISKRMSHEKVTVIQRQTQNRKIPTIPASLLTRGGEVTDSENNVSISEKLRLHFVGFHY